MEEQEKIRILIGQMLRLLITYEVELTAYHQTFEGTERRFKEAGIPFEARVSLKRISGDPRLLQEARALYASCQPLLVSLTPKHLDDALAALKNLIAARNQEPALDPNPLASDDSPVN
jgi:hypothetical protein